MEELKEKESKSCNKKRKVEIDDEKIDAIVQLKKKQKAKKRRISFSKLSEEEKIEKLSELERQYSRDNKVKLSSFGPNYGSNKKVKWICPKSKCSHPHEWEAMVCDRSRGSGCPCCEGLKICPCDSFMSDPPLAAQFYPDLNPNIDAYKIPKKSTIKISWRCVKTNCDNKCEHVWVTAVCHRVNGTNCPFCSGRAVCKCNSIVMHPLYHSQFDQTLNPNLDACKISKGSSIIVRWYCKETNCRKECKHIWEVSPNSRNHSNCPFCTGGRSIFCPCKSLLGTFPTITSEYDKEKNELPPDKIAPNSLIGIWWLCPKCAYSYRATVGNRTRKNGSSCPKCRMSKGEKKLEAITQLLEMKYELQYPLKCRNEELKKNTTLRCDLFWPDLNAAAEADGVQHFTVVKHFKMSLESVLRRDVRKERVCTEKKIHLLRISYLEFNKMEEIIRNFHNLIRRQRADSAPLLIFSNDALYQNMRRVLVCK